MSTEHESSTPSPSRRGFFRDGILAATAGWMAWPHEARAAEDPRADGAEKIKDIKVVRTVIDGRTVYVHG